MEIAPAERETLLDAGVAIIEHKIERPIRSASAITAWRMHGGETHEFDTIYSAHGTRTRSALAIGLGVEADRGGAPIVDPHQRTRIPGLFAAGDVVRGCTGERGRGPASIAATTMNASLPFPRA
jgi:thioredoxin reductase (NADPH)